MVEFQSSKMSENNDFADQVLSVIGDKLNEPMAVGQTWYVIDVNWYNKFKLFVGIDNPGHCVSGGTPGPIDNSMLLDQAQKRMKPNMVEQLNYVTIPQSAWDLLYSYFGIKEGQSPLPREVINLVRKAKQQELRVEVYRVELNLFNNPSLQNAVTHSFSQVDLISKVEKFCRDKFNVSNSQSIQLVCYYDPKAPRRLKSTNTIYEETINNFVHIVMEITPPQPMILPSSSTVTSEIVPRNFTKPAVPKTKDQSRILRGAAGSANIKPSTSMVTRSVAAGKGSAEGKGPPKPPGLCGLMNLGNTCFLNSIIQCLSNCGPITQYFLDGRHKLEINETNPLGKAGQIASSFAEVISMMWSGDYSVVVPQYFKLQLTKFATQFAGCQQHDAQELLTFLLDGLHEDLNRVKDKPYFQEEDENMEDDELARTSWEHFLQRNDSIIIDHFHGMLKSRVVCPDCEKVSIKFDPFSNLPLPLPVRCVKAMVVRYIPYDQSAKIINFSIIVPRKGIIQDMILELSRITKVKEEHMIIAEITKGHFHKFFSNDDRLDLIQDKDQIHMYDLPEAMMEDTNVQYSILPVVLWEIQDVPRTSHYISSLFGTPFLMLVPQKPIQFKTLYDCICERMTRACKGFKDANENYSSMFTECDEGDRDTNYNDRHDTKNYNIKYLFIPILVNSYSNDFKRIEEDDEDPFPVPECFGRDLLALQISRKVRIEHYKDTVILSKDCAHEFNPRPKIGIEDCLGLFTTTEKLCETNAWYCPQCKQRKKATKKLDLWKLPNILIFQMKRFSFNEIKKEKLKLKIDFPLTGLDISRYVVNKHREKLVYDLIGVCNHYGGLTGGHYAAMCKSYRNGKWYCFDDTSVRQIELETVQTESAYLLFYQRRQRKRANPDEEKVDF